MEVTFQRSMQLKEEKICALQSRYITYIEDNMPDMVDKDTMCPTEQVDYLLSYLERSRTQ